MQKEWERVFRQRSRVITVKQFCQNLTEILVSRRVMGVSDPRDMIFAHLGVAGLYNIRGNDVRELAWCEPDYSVPWYEVYEDLAANLLQHDHDIISFAESKLDFCLRSDGLPSWAPNWVLGSPYLPKTSLRVARKQYRDDRGFISKAYVPPVATRNEVTHILTETRSILMCRGGVLGILEGVSNTLLPSSEASEAVRLLDLPAHAGAVNDAATDRVEDTNLNNKFVAIQFEFLRPGIRLTAEERVQKLATSFFACWQERLSPYRMSTSHSTGDSAYDPLDKYYESIFTVFSFSTLKSGEGIPLLFTTPSESRSFLDDRRLGKFGSGALALVPYLAQRGDIVCMLAEDDMPLLLRSIEIPPNEQATMTAEIQEAMKNHEEVLQYRHYLYVGECWVEGAMSVIPKHPTQRQERKSRFGLTDEWLVLH